MTIWFIPGSRSKSYILDHTHIRGGTSGRGKSLQVHPIRDIFSENLRSLKAIASTPLCQLVLHLNCSWVGNGTRLNNWVGNASRVKSASWQNWKTIDESRESEPRLVKTVMCHHGWCCALINFLLLIPMTIQSNPNGGFFVSVLASTLYKSCNKNDSSHQ